MLKSFPFLPCKDWKGKLQTSRSIWDGFSCAEGLQKADLISQLDWMITVGPFWLEILYLRNGLSSWLFFLPSHGKGRCLAGEKKTFQTLSIATVQWESLNPCWHHLMQKYHYKDTELLPKDIEGFIYPLLQVVGMLQMQINLKNMY